MPNPLGNFDPYHKWLGIPAREQPPHHYRLLGIDAFESDADVIEQAADRQMAHLRTHQTSRYGELSQKLLNEIAAARLALLQPERKAAYDRVLQARLSPAAAPIAANRAPSVAVLPVARPLPAPSLMPASSTPHRQAWSFDVTVPSVVTRRAKRSKLPPWAALAATLSLAAMVCGGVWKLRSEPRPAPAKRVAGKKRGAHVAPEAAAPRPEKDMAGGSQPRATRPAGPPTSPQSSASRSFLPGPPTDVTREDSTPAQSTRAAENELKEIDAVPPGNVVTPPRPPRVLPAPARPPAALLSANGPIVATPDRPAPHLPADDSTRRRQDTIDAGLVWLARAQRPDGSWSFTETEDPGSNRSTVAASAMTLVPFLRAGHTLKTGAHKKVVERGLQYLVSRAVLTPEGADLRDGQSMYVHAQATIALCEACVSIKRVPDPLWGTAQAAVYYIVSAQDPIGGGWRYQPRQSGDTSVLGWQVTALTLAGASGLDVPPRTLLGAHTFLGSVAENGNSAYGYTGHFAGCATTAIGLTCRLLLGDGKDSPGIAEGVTRIAASGPHIESDLYHDHFATRLIRLWGGVEWEAWRQALETAILNSRVRHDERTCSWFEGIDGGGQVRAQVGRLGTTALCLRLLEETSPSLPATKVPATKSRTGQSKRH